MPTPTATALRFCLLALSLTGLVALAACNGTALATLTATASPTAFLTYRVNLLGVTLQNSSSTGSTSVNLFPTSTTVDLAKLANLSEVLGIATVKKGSYTSVLVTVDYTGAVIVADNGTATGVTLKPVNASGGAMGQVQLTLNLDSANQLSITKNQTSRLALNFDLAASNIVDLSTATVTVTPMILASALPIDSNLVRIRGQVQGISTSTDSSTNTTSLSYTSNVIPFDGATASTGNLPINPSDVTTYEINGTASTGAIGQTQFQSLANGTWAVAYGTFTSGASSTTTDTSGTTGTTDTTTIATTGSTSSQDISFSASAILAGSSVQGSGSDRISGVVTEINGDAATVSGATLLTSAGAVSYVTGTTTVTVGANTAVTLPQQSSASVANTTAQISVGSVINAFGTATVAGSGDVDLDAAAGRVRLDTSTAWGTVAVVPDTSAGEVTIALADLDGRSVNAFNFTGTGGSSGVNSTTANYVVSAAGLTLSNLTAVDQPLEATGTVTPYGSAGTTISGSATPDFVATSLLDPTTLLAELVVNWGAGTPTPFNAYSSTEIDLLIHNSSIGTQHIIQSGSQTIDFTTLPSDALIEPSTTSTSVVYAIGHTSTGTIDNYDTFADFITALQADLNGTTLATSMTVQGVYTAASYLITANNVTIYLNI
jgi:hypothetical protein